MNTYLHHSRAKRAPVSSLLCALLALAAGPLQAVNVSTNNEGQVLIFPYYTIRDSNVTLVSVVNHSDSVKALKVRVLEGENGRVIAHRNLYLGPFDTWTASFTQRDGVPVLNTDGNACLVPALEDTALALDLSAFDDAPDSGRDSADRVREGYMEVIEMGTIERTGLGGNAIYQAGAVQPLGCDNLVAAWEEGGVWRDDAVTDFAPPSGGLAGNAAVVNQAGARAAAYRATALNQFYVPTAEQPVALHFPPESSEPGLAAAFPAVSHVRLENAPGASDAEPVLISDEWADGLSAVSAALIVDGVNNQYARETGIGGRSEWVVSFPTKSGLTQADTGALAPFTTTFDEPQNGSGDGQACETASATFFTRNGVGQGNGNGGPPLNNRDNSPQLCYAVNVVSFNSGQQPRSAVANERGNLSSELLGSRLFVNIRPQLLIPGGGDAGSATLSFNRSGDNPIEHVLINPVSGRIYAGLPAVGFATQGATNRSINALFGTGYSHGYTRTISATP